MPEQGSKRLLIFLVKASEEETAWSQSSKSAERER